MSEVSGDDRLAMTALLRAANPADVGRRIRTARIARRATQTDLATAVGISVGQVSRGERGERRFRLDVIEAISAFVDVPVRLLITGAVDNAATIEDVSAALATAVLLPEDERVAWEHLVFTYAARFAAEHIESGLNGH